MNSFEQVSLKSKGSKKTVLEEVEYFKMHLEDVFLEFSTSLNEVKIESEVRYIFLFSRDEKT